MPAPSSCAKQRAAAEGVRLEVVLRIVAQTRRDRDAATAAPLLRHRAVFEQMLADRDELAVTLARLAMRATLAAGDENHPQIRASRVAGQQGLNAIQRMGRALSGAGAKGCAMGRGKYRRRKTRPDERSWRAAVDRLRDEIAAETARLSTGRARAAATATTQQQLARERAHHPAALSPIARPPRPRHISLIVVPWSSTCTGRRLSGKSTTWSRSLRAKRDSTLNRDAATIRIGQRRVPRPTETIHKLSQASGSPISCRIRRFRSRDP